MNRQNFSKVPTNIITGFLGAGKTTAILHLLNHKPQNERWAVLVNEFGEIGIDGCILQGQPRQEGDVFIREVPGGCMCCSAGVSMQVALNQLLQKAKPDRLLIEPTGLGHPQQILKTLNGEYFRHSLSIEKVLTLVDARNLSDQRYTEHGIFTQQIAIADEIIATKRDLYQATDEQALQDYMQRMQLHKPLTYALNGQVPIQCLTATSTTETALADAALDSHANVNFEQGHRSKQQTALAAGDYINVSNQGEGYQSIGWRFAQDIVFEQTKLRAFLQQLAVERMKAVFITTQGVFSYNLNKAVLKESPLAICQESKLEIINPQINTAWEQQLLACRKETS